MTDTLFKEVHYSLDGLIGDIGLGRIGLPDIQHPFVWVNAKTMSYAQFLAARRPLIAGVIRQGHQKLAGMTA